jgi:hypothetical protein
MPMRKAISRQSGLAFPVVVIDEAGSMPLLGTTLKNKQVAMLPRVSPLSSLARASSSPLVTSRSLLHAASILLA